MAEKLDKFKYPLVVLVIGVVLMLLPSGSSSAAGASEEEPMAQLLSNTEGESGSHLRKRRGGGVPGSGKCQGAPGYYSGRQLIYWFYIG